jgi:hypothetical protein
MRTMRSRRRPNLSPSLAVLVVRTTLTNTSRTLGWCAMGATPPTTLDAWTHRCPECRTAIGCALPALQHHQLHAALRCTLGVKSSPRGRQRLIQTQSSRPLSSTLICKGSALSSFVTVRCAFSDRNSHSRMLLDPTPARLKRTCV